MPVQFGHKRKRQRMTMREFEHGGLTVGRDTTRRKVSMADLAWKIS